MNIDIKKIATLARLQLSKEEEKLYEQQIEEILKYMEILKEVDTSNTEATYQVTGLTGKERTDTVKHDGIHGISGAIRDCSKYYDGTFIELPPVL